MNQTKYYRADQLEFSFLQEMDSKYYSDRADAIEEEDLYHQIFDDLRKEDDKLNLRNLNTENPWD